MKTECALVKGRPIRKRQQCLERRFLKWNLL